MSQTNDDFENPKSSVLHPETRVEMSLAKFLSWTFGVASVTAAVVFFVASALSSGDDSDVSSNLLEVVQTALPQETTESTTPNFERATQVFGLGYDLLTLQAFALLIHIEEDPLFEEVYSGVRPLVLQDAKLADIEIEEGIPTLSELQELSLDEVTARFEEIESEVRAKVESEGSARLRQYSYGSWLGRALVSVAVARLADEAQVRQLLDDRTEKFDKDLVTFKDFDISDSLKEEFGLIRDELETLAQIGSVSDRDYVEFSQKVYTLQDAVREGRE